MAKVSLNENDHPKNSLAKALCGYFSGALSKLNRTQRTAHKSALNHLISHFGSTPLKSVKVADIKQFISALQAKHKTPKTLNKALDIMRAVFELNSSGKRNAMSGIPNLPYSSKTNQPNKGIIRMDPHYYEENTVARQVCEICERNLKNCAPSSHADKKSAYRKIIAVLGATKKLDELTIDDFHYVRTHCLTDMKTSRTWNKVLSCLRNLNDYALSKNAINHSFLDTSCGYIKPSLLSKRAYSRNAIETIIQNKAQDELSWLLFVLSYHLLTRGCEIIALTLGCITFYIDENTNEEVADIRIELSKSQGSGKRSNPHNHCYKNTKTNETRTITIDPIGTKRLKRAVALAKKYPATSYDKLSDDKVFVSQQKARFLFINPKTKKPWQSTSEYSQVFLKDYLDSLDIKNLGLSKIRNTVTTHLLEAGVSRTQVKKVLGHSPSSKCLENYYEVQSIESKINNTQKANSHFTTIYSPPAERSKLSPRKPHNVLNKIRSLASKLPSFLSSLIQKNNSQMSQENEVSTRTKNNKNQVVASYELF